MKKHIIAFLFLSVYVTLVHAQLIMNAGQTPEWYVNNVLVGDGVVASNVVFKGSHEQIASFSNGVTTNLGINRGLVLSSGKAVDIVGPNNTGSKGTNMGNSSSDADFIILGVSNTRDLCVLEFDFIPTGSSIEFEYVFGSEEYPEYANSSFNDVFGFFLSGPGIAGIFTNNARNIASLPGTNQFVSINNVNHINNSQFYINNSGGLTIQYDGFTTVLKATATVIPGETYHIKLAIADVSDNIYDSGVCIKAGSFSSPLPELSVTYSHIDDIQSIIQGCSSAKFNYSFAEAYPIDSLISITIGGTAVNGIDYTFIENSFTIKAGETKHSFPIEVNPNVNIVSPLFIELTVPKTDTTDVTYSIPIISTQNISFVPDSVLCGDSLVAPKVDGSKKYNWYFSENDDNPIAFSKQNNPIDSILLQDIVQVSGSFPNRLFTLWVEEVEEVKTTLQTDFVNFDFSDKYFYTIDTFHIKFDVVEDMVLNGYDVLYKNDIAGDFVEVKLIDDITNLELLSKSIYFPYTGASATVFALQDLNFELHANQSYRIEYSSPTKMNFQYSSSYLKNEYPDSVYFGNTNIVNVKGVYYSIYEFSMIMYMYNWEVIVDIPKGNACGRIPYTIQEHCTVCTKPISIDFISDTSFCDYNTLLLEANYELFIPQKKHEFSWYKDDVLIETTSEYKDLLIDSVLGSGVYKLKIHDVESKDADCFIEQTLDIQAIHVQQPIVQIIDSCDISFAIIVETYDSYMWSTSETNDTIQFTNSGNHSVYVINDGCISPNSDFEIQIVVSPNPPIVTDIEYCEGDESFALTAEASGDLLWYDAYMNLLADAPVPSSDKDGLTSYYVVQSVNGCVSTASEIVVTVYATPQKPEVQDLEYCLNDTVNSLEATAIGDLTWYYNTQKLSEAPVPNTQSEGSQLYTVSQTVNGCESPQAKIQVTVKPLPQMPVCNDTAFCHNQSSLAFSSVFADGSVSWYMQETGGVALLSEPTLYSHTVGTQSYYLSQTVNACEGPRRKVDVVIRPIPTKPICSDVAVCQFSDENTLTASAHGDKVWYSDSFDVLEKAPTPSTQISGTTVYYVSQMVQGCESEKSKINVLIKPMPDKPICNDTAYCHNAVSQMLIPKASGTIKWYAFAEGGTPMFVNLKPSTSTVGENIFYVSQTINGCESPREEVTVTIHPIPQMPVSSDVSYCLQDESLPLDASGEGILTWYQSKSGGVALPDVPKPATNIVGKKYYYVTQTVNGCESPRKEIVVTVKTIPPAPNANNFQYCQFDDIDPLYVIGSGTKRWYEDASSVVVLPSAPKPSTDFAGVFSFFVTQTINGCESPRKEVLVTVNPQPIAPDVPAHITYCQFDTIPDLEIKADGTLQWYIQAQTGVQKLASNFELSTARYGVIQYYVSQTVLGCESPKSPLILEVKKAPVFSFSSNDANNVVCVGDTIVLEVLPEELYELTWWNSNTSIYSENTMISEQIMEPTTYYLHALAENLCELMDSVVIGVSYAPEIEIFGKTLFCEHTHENQFVLETNDNAIDVAWYNTGSSFVFIKDNSTKRVAYVDFYSAGVDTIYVVASNVEKCSSTDSIVVYVAKYPQADFEAFSNNDAIFMENLSTQEQLDSNAGVEITMSYTWNFISPIEETIYQSHAEYHDVQSIFHHYLANSITLVAINSFGCVDSITKPVDVDIFTGLYFPRAFSPSNPAHGVRHFSAIGMNLLDCKVWVYDQWGNIVWYGDEVQRGIFTAKWDGTYNGTMMKSDTYFWRAEATFLNGVEWQGYELGNGKYSKMGSFVLVR